MTRLRCFGASARSLFKNVPAAARALTIVLLIGTLLVGIGVWSLHHWDPAFEAIARAHQDSAFVRLAQGLSYWGELHLIPLIALVILGGVGIKTEAPPLAWAALAGLISGCAGGILVNIAKVIVGRPRPFTNIADGVYWFTLGGDHASFPSGHATHCFAVAAGVAMLAPRSGAALSGFAVAVCWARWYLLRHYVTDVVSGAWLGLAVGLIVGVAARRAWQRSAPSAMGEANFKTRIG